MNRVLIAEKDDRKTNLNFDKRMLMKTSMLLGEEK
jgi:hypothetical protein